MRRVVGDADPYECVARGRQQKNRREATLPSCKDTNLLIRSHGLDDLDLTAIVSTALLAHSVRQVQRTAFRACNETGDSQLPSGAAPLVASCFGYFSLRYCHCDTSLIFQRPGRSSPSLVCFFICSPKAWPGLRAAGPLPFHRSRGRGSGQRRTGGTVPCNLPNTMSSCPFRG